MPEPSQALTPAAIAEIVQRDVPGFVPAPAASQPSAQALSFSIGSADAVVSGPKVAPPVGDSDVIAVKVVPAKAADSPSPFPRGRTVLINTKLRRVEAAQG